MCAFTQILGTKKLINTISFKSKQSILSNVLKSTIWKNVLLNIVSPVDAMKNTLTLGFHIVLIKANNIGDNIASTKYNCTSKGCRLRNNIKARKYANIIIFLEFRDSFSLHMSLTTKNSLALHIITF